MLKTCQCLCRLLSCLIPVGYYSNKGICAIYFFKDLPMAGQSTHRNAGMIRESTLQCTSFFLAYRCQAGHTFTVSIPTDRPPTNYTHWVDTESSSLMSGCQTVFILYMSRACLTGTEACHHNLNPCPEYSAYLVVQPRHI